MKTVPIEIHKLQGTVRKHRHQAAIDASAAVTDYGAPTCPEWLSAAAKEAWAAIVPTLAARRVLTLADSSALQVLAVSFAEWRQLTEDLQTEGLTYECKTEAGAVMRRPNPKVVMRSDAQRRLNVAFSEFGLTAASRGKIPPLSDSKKDNRFAGLGK